MSKTQLQTNNAKLSELITTLQGKTAGGGGSNVETCTVTITYSVGKSAMLTWYVVGYNTETGEIVQHYNPNDEAEATTLTFDDVICGSIFMLYCEGMGIPSSCAVTGGAKLIKFGSMPGMSGTRVYVKAPITAGSVCTCTIT